MLFRSPNLNHPNQSLITKLKKGFSLQKLSALVAKREAVPADPAAEISEQALAGPQGEMEQLQEVEPLEEAAAQVPVVQVAQLAAALEQRAVALVAELEQGLVAAQVPAEQVQPGAGALAYHYPQGLEQQADSFAEPGLTQAEWGLQGEPQGGSAEQPDG